MSELQNLRKHEDHVENILKSEQHKLKTMSLQTLRTRQKRIADVNLQHVIEKMSLGYKIKESQKQFEQDV